jgi:hypothetical protein
MRYEMKCHSIQKKLSAYQDLELKPQEEEVRNHLLNCRSCRKQYAELEGVWQKLREFEGIAPDPGFYRRLVRRRNEPSPDGFLPALQSFFRPFSSPALASALVVIGILAGIYAGNFITRYNFLPGRQNQAGYSQDAFLDSLKVFDPAPPGTLANGYLQMVSYKENEHQ